MDEKAVTIDDILHTRPLKEEKVLRIRFGIGVTRTLPLKNGAVYRRSYTDRDEDDFPKEVKDRIPLGPNGHTFEEVGHEIGRSGDRIRNIEGKALRLLRKQQAHLFKILLRQNDPLPMEVVNLTKAVLGTERVEKIISSPERNEQHPRAEQTSALTAPAPSK